MKKNQEPLQDLTPEGQLSVGVMAPIVGYLLAQASVTTDQVFAAVTGTGLSLRKVEFTILALVLANPNVTGSALAKALSVTSPNITMWLDKLESRGLIERERSTRDRRAQHVRATAEGRSVVQDVANRVVAAEQLALAGLTAGERAILSELLHKVAKSRHRAARPRDRALGLSATQAPGAEPPA